MKNKYTNAGQQRILKLIFALFGDVVSGYPPATLAKHVGCSASAMTRDLHNLLEAGAVECDEKTGNWRLTAHRLPQQAVKVFGALQNAEARLDEVRSAIRQRS